MIISGYSDKGIFRQDNQDSFYAVKLGDNRALLGLFDGMGGLSDGAKASATVLGQVKEAVSGGIHTGVYDIEEALRKANDLIYNNTAGKGGKPSGSTATIALVNGLNLRVWHAGDSRAILFHDGTPRVLTHDDTAYNRFYAEAKNPNEKYNDQRYRSVLVRAVGASRNFKISVWDYTAQQGDNLLLCSDGFWHSIQDGRVQLPTNNVGASLEGMVAKIESLGEKDNITACVLEGIRYYSTGKHAK